MNTQIAELEKQLESAHALIEAYENREVACCPEDVGFEEVISTLTESLARIKSERDAALKGWADAGTEYACLSLDHDELKDAIATRINELLLVNRATGVSANEIAAAVMELIPENV